MKNPLRWPPTVSYAKYLYIAVKKTLNSCVMDVKSRRKNPPSLNESLSSPKKGENAGDQIERTLQIVERGSKHGNPQLIDSFGYTYHVIRRGVKSTVWQCMVTTEGTLCQATVTQWKNGIFTVKEAHNGFQHFSGLKI